MNRPRILILAVTGLILALRLRLGRRDRCQAPHRQGHQGQEHHHEGCEEQQPSGQGHQGRHGVYQGREEQQPHGRDIQDGTVAGADIQDGTVSGADIQNGSVATGDLANGSVTANKIAPGAIAFPNSLWSTLFRNQTGAAESNVQVGPGGAGQLNDGSLRLFTSTATDVAAFGNSFEFAGVRLDQITDMQYSTYNPAPRPSPGPRCASRSTRTWWPTTPWAVPPSSPPWSTSRDPARRGG